MKDQKKILFVLEHFHPYIGGAEKLFILLSQALVKKGFQVTVVTSKYDKTLPLGDDLNGVKIIRVRCYNRFGFTFLSIPKIIKYARKCDIIHTTTYNAALPAFVAAKISRKAVVVTFHELWGKLWDQLPFISNVARFAFKNFEKLIANLPFDYFVAVSDFTKSKLIEGGIDKDKVVRIYNGLDYRDHQIKNSASNIDFTFTYFGRLGISKGLDLLIPATSRFLEKHPNATLKLIIPTTPSGLYNQVLELVQKYALKDKIQILHSLPYEQLEQEVLASSCVVIPSYSEGFCFVAAETVGLGVPIISSGQGALKETVTGKFIIMKDQSIGSLVDALERAYNNDWTSNPVKKFRMDDSIQEYLDFYARLLSN